MADRIGAERRGAAAAAAASPNGPHANVERDARLVSTGGDGALHRLAHVRWEQRQIAKHAHAATVLLNHVTETINHTTHRAARSQRRWRSSIALASPFFHEFVCLCVI